MYFTAVYDRFCGSVRVVPMSRTLWGPDRQLSGDQSQKQPFWTIRVTTASRPISEIQVA